MSDFWAGFEHDPRQADNSVLRAADRDRDQVRDMLGTAYAEGRLTREEFDERNEQVTDARTLGDLPPIVVDLVAQTPAVRPPADLRAEAERRYRADRRESFTFLGPALICWVIWAWVLVQGHGTPFPWPIFVTLGTAMPAIRMWMNPEDHIVARQRKLEKEQQRRALGAASPAPGTELDEAADPEPDPDDWREEFRRGRRHPHPRHPGRRFREEYRDRFRGSAD